MISSFFSFFLPINFFFLFLKKNTTVPNSKQNTDQNLIQRLSTSSHTQLHLQCERAWRKKVKFKLERSKKANKRSSHNMRAHDPVPDQLFFRHRLSQFCHRFSCLYLLLSFHAIRKLFIPFSCVSMSFVLSFFFPVP